MHYSLLRKYLCFRPLNLFYPRQSVLLIHAHSLIHAVCSILYHFPVMDFRKFDSLWPRRGVSQWSNYRGSRPYVWQRCFLQRNFKTDFTFCFKLMNIWLTLSNKKRLVRCIYFAAYTYFGCHKPSLILTLWLIMRKFKKKKLRAQGFSPNACNVEDWIIHNIQKRRDILNLFTGFYIHFRKVLYNGATQYMALKFLKKWIYSFAKFLEFFVEFSSGVPHSVPSCIEI